MTLAESVDSVIHAYVAVFLQVMNRGAEVPFVVDREVNPKPRLRAGAGGGEPNLVSFIEHHHALLLFRSLRHPVIIAV